MAQPGDTRSIPIIEAYNDYRPPSYVTGAVEKLLRTVPQKYLVGLESVVLTNRSSQPRRERRRRFSHGRRNIPLDKVLAFYSPASRRKRPYIEIYVDKVLARPKWYSALPLFREIVIGAVLFHELGHHIHYTLRPEHRNEEPVANRWSEDLLGNFIRKRYWYLLPLLVLAARIAKAIKDGRETKRKLR